MKRDHHIHHCTYMYAMKNENGMHYICIHINKRLITRNLLHRLLFLYQIYACFQPTSSSIPKNCSCSGGSRRVYCFFLGGGGTHPLKNIQNRPCSWEWIYQYFNRSIKVKMDGYGLGMCLGEKMSTQQKQSLDGHYRWKKRKRNPEET